MQQEQLILATQTGSLTAFESIIAPQPWLVLLRDEDNVSLLHWAAINNHTHLVHRILLLAASLPVNSAGNAVSLAAYSAASSVVNSNSGLTDPAVRFCDSLGGALQATALHWAVRSGALDASIALVEIGQASLEVQDSQGLRCLHTAAAFDQHLAAMYLVAKGAELEARDAGTGRTPLLWACCLHKTGEAVAFVLLKCGANVNAVDVDGRTALHWALITVSESD